MEGLLPRIQGRIYSGDRPQPRQRRQAHGRQKGDVSPSRRLFRRPCCHDNQERRFCKSRALEQINEEGNMHRLITVIVGVLGIASISWAPPCNWTLFTYGCANDGPCGWNCDPYETYPYSVCYTNGSGCCICQGTIWHRHCLFSDATYYELNRFQYTNSICKSDTPVQHCEAITP